MPYDLSKMNAHKLELFADEISKVESLVAHLKVMGYDLPIDLTGAPLLRLPMVKMSASVVSSETPKTGRLTQDSAPFPVTTTLVAGMQEWVANSDPQPTAQPAAKDLGPGVKPKRGKKVDWTPEEDETAVRLAAQNLDLSQTDLYDLIGRELGRPAGGVGFRCKNALKDRVRIARNNVRQVAKKTDANPQPVSEPNPQPAPMATSKQAGNSIPHPPNAPVWHRELNATLNALGYIDPWTPELDLELVERLGWGATLGMVALDFGIDTAVCKARYVQIKTLAACDSGSFGIDEQTRLLAVLRARVAETQRAAGGQEIGAGS